MEKSQNKMVVSLKRFILDPVLVKPKRGLEVAGFHFFQKCAYIFLQFVESRKTENRKRTIKIANVILINSTNEIGSYEHFFVFLNITNQGC